MHRLLIALLLCATPASAGLDIPVPLEQRAALPGGGQVVLHAVTPRRHAIGVHVTIVAGAEDVVLALSGLSLEDGRGHRHGFLPPRDNAQLWVPHGVALEGELLFAGRRDPAATRFLLRFNSGFAAGSRAPQVSLGFELPATAAARVPGALADDATRLEAFPVGPAAPLAAAPARPAR